MISKAIRKMRLDGAFKTGNWDNRKIRAIPDIQKAIKACEEVGFLAKPVSERDLEQLQTQALERMIGKRPKELRIGDYIACYYLASNWLLEFESEHANQEIQEESNLLFLFDNKLN
ncbi:hypothetical protein OGZ51_07160 [Lactococcus lactis]|uniref:Uncharacterized protein n=1 Tax=Lactococcus lactis TaxID=1358 RepID=A0A9X4NI98_9LACT|nr:hypothetical protein [Lactococcus lactis]MDG4983919.1 hypothetical protein [Lactococcus lactis]